MPLRQSCGYTQKDVAKVNRMIPQTVLIGLVVAIVGYFLQQRAWRHKTYEEIRQREFDECLKLVDALGRSIDKRLMAISSFRSDLLNDSVTSERFTEYRDSIKDWMFEFSTFKSRLYHYFGREMMLTFENEVHGNLREVSDILVRTHKLGFNNLSVNDKQEHSSALTKIDFARYTAFKFLRELNEQLAAGDVGRTKLYNNVDVGDLELISRTYLAQRLLGLKS